MVGEIMIVERGDFGLFQLIHQVNILRVTELFRAKIELLKMRKSIQCCDKESEHEAVIEK